MARLSKHSGAFPEISDADVPASRGARRATALEQVRSQYSLAHDSSRVNIGEVRAILGRISSNSGELGNRLDVLVSGVQAQAEERGEATQAWLGHVIGLVAVFSVLLVVAAGVISYFLDAYLRGIQERRRFEGMLGDALTSRRTGAVLLLGVVWSPCVGPTLGAAMLLLGLFILTGLDKRFETWVLDVAPAWLTQIGTSL